MIMFSTTLGLLEAANIAVELVILHLNVVMLKHIPNFQIVNSAEVMVLTLVELGRLNMQGNLEEKFIRLLLSREVKI